MATESRKGGNREDLSLVGDGGHAAIQLLQGGGDILWLVFRLLPMRILFQCKSVCRAWNSIISDLDFRKQYLSDASKRSIYVQLQTSSDHRKRSRNHYSTICSFPRFIPNGKPPTGPIYDEICSNNFCFPVTMDLLGTSAGLLLLANRFSHEYLVYNPLTTATDELPFVVPPFNIVNNLVCSFQCSEPKQGISSSESSYEYEVIRIDSVSSLSPAIQMYNSKNRSRQWVTKYASWQIPQGYHRLGPKETRRVTLGEKLYWTLTTHHIGVFDKITGMMDMLPLPQQRNCLTPNLSMDASGGLLCVVWNNAGFDVLLLRCPAGSYTWATATTEERWWAWMHKVEYGDVLKDYPVPLSDLNSGGTTSLMFYSPNHLLVFSSRHHAFYDLVSRKLLVRNGNFDLLCQWGRGLIARYQLPSWPFRLPG